jgi:glycerophosphoryl diester phosphodiesterase
MSLKLPKIIGHRGCAAYAPENTLVGIHTAADMGVEWVELDVKLTKDQVPILFHDELLERTTDGTGEVKDHTYAQLKELDAGLWFGDSFFDTRIPTLEQAIDVLIERDLGVNIEIKPCPGRERETAEVALDLLASVWDDHSRMLISSFQHVSLEAALEMA